MSGDKKPTIAELHKRLDEYYQAIAPIVAERCRLNGMVEKIILHPDGRVEYILPERVKRIDEQYEQLLLEMMKMYLGDSPILPTVPAE